MNLLRRVMLALVGWVLWGGALASGANAQVSAYLDPELPIEVRVRDLVRRMTLEEKVSQMVDRAPAIPRLGIPEYNWWNEALHGVARSGLATSFPQAIGLAATWNDSLIRRMANVISEEARAKHHEYVRNGTRLRYQGLTLWSPNINLFRDPRWGRGQETYGEDPYLTGRLAVQFIRGLQGEDPKYLKTVATVKHFAVHSGPEPERHRFDAVVSERDLRESYLPHFELGIREGGAYSLMCAYNRVAGDPACASDELIRDILRGEWGFRGFIVSDCGAIDDIYLRHRVVRTAAEAAAVAVRTGTDLDCGNVYSNLVDAARQGLITEAEIDTAVTRLFTARFRLGMFDPADRVAYARIPYGVLDQPAHRELAREVARESMVLMKNDGVLPLRKDLGTLAVIGPNADQWLMLLGNYNGTPADPITPLRGIREALGLRTRVLYARGAELAEGFPMYDVVPSNVLFAPDGRPGLHVEYYATGTREGAPLFTGTDMTLDANWRDRAPRPEMNADDFGVTWTATLRPRRSGTYQLGIISTMKFELFVDDSLVVRSVYNYRDEFGDPRLRATAPMRLEAGRTYRLRVDTQESYGDAQTQLVWAGPHTDLEAEAVSAAQQADAVVLFLGLTARLEGEEMPIQIEGFRGGDRTQLGLPATQQRLLERITAIGKPTVLVLLNGSALEVNWAQEHVPAILEAWYPGQAAGVAIADVLFGDYNPGGRLPVTFYRSVSDLPPFGDYAMAGRTYRFFEGDPLYPFGHGLSYTTFAYGDLRASADTLADGETITVSVDVTNAGVRSGDEVVQLYVEHVNSAVARPRRELKGFQRIALRPAETRTVTFTLAPSALAYWDADADRWVVEDGTVRLRVGSSSEDLRLERTVRVKASAQQNPLSAVKSTLPEPRNWTAAEDHRNMMEQLGIRALRPGPSGNEQAPNAANYDEAKANPFPTLPEVLTLNSGQNVTTRQLWSRRRAEIVELFEREIYGRVPRDVPVVTWTVTETDSGTIAGRRVIGKRLSGRVDNSSYPLIGVDISAVLVLPADSKGAVPVMIMFRPGTLAQALGRPAPAPAGRPAFTPPAGSDAPGTEQLIVDGWGFVFLNPASVQADNGAGLTKGIIGLVNKGQPRKPDDWGALRAWAWGASRLLDHLEMDRAVNAKQVGIEGVSRYGKAALVTMAFDQRFAAVMIGSSGAGGAKLHRRNWGEAVENLTGSGEYHWMAGNFLKYGAADASFGSKNAGDIPVDAHQLIALCAPRLTFVSYGVPARGDAKWLDHQGSFMAAVAAQPVFRLLGARDLGVSDDHRKEQMPPVNVGLLGGQLAWRQHDGGHTDAPNWKYFLSWADHFFGRRYTPAPPVKS